MRTVAWCAVASFGLGCVPQGTNQDPTGEVSFDAADAESVSYRDDLASHPGCSTAGLSYAAADLAGYTCAAKDYSGEVDPTKPIVLLVHGNSDTPSSWEAYDAGGACDAVGATEGQDQLAELLKAAGFRTLAVDLRYDLVDDPANNNETENAAKNMDHGWAVPITEHFFTSAMEAYPDDRFVVMGFSLGTTVVRDALRRMLVNDGVNMFERLDHAFLLAGANHGVSSFALCGVNPTMRGQVACEMGDRAAFAPTEFLASLNGPEGAHETPCGDGETAFGAEGVCAGAVNYTTIVMEDLPDGEQQDLFVSEASSRLAGAENLTIGLNDFDESNYFFCGLFRNHYGAARGTEALGLIGDRLGF
jgi:pimeloyl-ACP methyl ester carboxylesterase